MQRILEKRVSNALIKDAVPDFEILFIVADMVGLEEIKNPLKLTMAVTKKMMGGLWVGGTTYLTEDALVFRPNWANRFFHEGDCSVSIPLTDIVEVTKVPGLVTQIIDAKTAKGTLRFRCYRRDSFYDLILAQWHSAGLSLPGCVIE
jgi:hypothetical protein